MRLGIKWKTTFELPQKFWLSFILSGRINLIGSEVDGVETMPKSKLATCTSLHWNIVDQIIQDWVRQQLNGFAILKTLSGGRSYMHYP